METLGVFAHGRPASSMARVRRRATALRGVVVGALVATAAVIGFGPASSVEAAPDDVVALVVEGTGFGHGRGMSQWGAYGYAVDHGWEWTRILDHYYGGTSSGSVPSGQRIHVRLTGYDGLGTVGVISHGSGVVWNGVSAPSMRAVETSSGRFDVYRGNTIGCPTTTALTVPDGPIGFGATGSDVSRIQQFLRAYQASSIGVDGSWGSQTRSILDQWQRARGLPAGGNTWDGDDAAAARAQIASSGGSVSWTRIGTHVQSPGNPLRFTTPGGDTRSTSRNSVLGVCSASGRVTHYRGAIHVVDSENGNRVVNDVSVENYLRGVVPKEISASWAAAGDGRGVHSVRAQSVAARSYGLSESRSGNSYEYRGSSTRFATTCDTTACQVYAGAATRTSATTSPTRVEYDATDDAILETAGVVRLWPNGSVVRTEFSASNGPRTAGGAFPPVDDIGDDTLPNPNHRWTRVLDADSIAAAHGLGTVRRAYMTETTSSQYQGFDGIWFDDVVIEGTTGTKRWNAWDFRNAFDLRSPGFTIRAVTRDTTASSFALIGDSVGNSIAGSDTSELRRLLDGTFAAARYDVVDSRCTVRTSCPGTSGVEAAAQVPQGTDLVIVELGYNDPSSSFPEAIDSMMTALRARGVTSVAWVNMADIRTEGGSSRYGPMNAALAAAQARWPQLSVLDWNGHSATPERDRWFSDGVHLTTTGQARFATWLRDAAVGAAPSHYLSPPERIILPVVGEELTTPAGETVVVPPDATGVAFNVTAVRPSARGYATVWPCAADRPLVSSLNYEGGQVVANSILAPIDADGTVCLYSSQGTHLVVDVAGWFDGPAPSGADSLDSGPAPFVGVEPVRLVDTRDGTGGRSGPVTPTTPLSITVVGREVRTSFGDSVTVPRDVAAVALNVGVVRPDRQGFVTLWPCGTERPKASNVNFARGAIVSNGVVAPVGSDGAVCVHVEANAEVVVDLAGFFDGSVTAEAADPGDAALAAGATPAFRSTVPTRLADTRPAEGGAGPVTPSTRLVVPVRGVELSDPTSPGGVVAVPDDATAIALNIAVARPQGSGYATVWPCSSDRPTASNLNYVAGRNVANGVVAPIGTDGTVCIHVSSTTHVIVDAAGWFRGGEAPSFVGAVPERFVDTRIAVGPVPV